MARHRGLCLGRHDTFELDGHEVGMAHSDPTGTKPAQHAARHGGTRQGALSHPAPTASASATFLHRRPCSSLAWTGRSGSRLHTSPPLEREANGEEGGFGSGLGRGRCTLAEGVLVVAGGRAWRAAKSRSSIDLLGLPTRTVVLDLEPDGNLA